MIGPLRRRFLQLRLWLVERLRWGELPSTLFWAGLTGFAGGLMSVLFRGGIQGVEWLLTGREGDLVQVAEELAWWRRMISPAIGGFFAGLILHYGMRLTKSQKTSDYMEALVVSNGTIGTRNTSIKSFSALFSIASGGAIGREGPMVSLAAMLGSGIGRLRRFSAPRQKLLVACGAAAGIAAAYNAPIAGALFVAEVILGTISMEMFGPLVFSSVVSTVTVHQLLGTRPTYDIPDFYIGSNLELPLFILLGIVAGSLSPLFIALLKKSEALFGKIRAPVYVRMLLGGVIVGVISVHVPQVWGNGYSVVNSILRENWFWSALVIVLLCKLISIGATVGSGAVGGVFTPTLFVGAAIGCLFGKAAHGIAPHFTTEAGGYALVGMGCFLAATTQAPLMAILMIFEMTLQYEIVLPLMLGCVTAHYTAKSFGQDSIYAGHLKRKQEEVQKNTVTHKAALVRDLMKTDPPTIAPNSSFGAIAHLFASYRINYVYVVSPERRFLGVVSLHEMKPHLNDPVLSETVVALDIMREDFPVLTPDQDLTEALRAFSKHDGERIPVVNDTTERRLIGIISKTDLLLSLAEISAVPMTAAT